MGVACYRAGQYQEATLYLTVSSRLYAARGRTEPCDYAFLAMSNFQLKQFDLARTYKAKLDELMQKDEFMQDEERKQFQKEVSTLFEADAGNGSTSPTQP